MQLQRIWLQDIIEPSSSGCDCNSFTEPLRFGKKKKCYPGVVIIVAIILYYLNESIESWSESRPWDKEHFLKKQNKGSELLASWQHIPINQKWKWGVVFTV